MTISIAQSRVTPTTEVGGRKISPGLFQGEFAARQGLERTVSAGVLTLADNMERLQFTTEVADAEVFYNAQFRLFQESELSNPDHTGAPDRFNKWHDATQAGITSGMRNSRARRQAESHFSRIRSRQGVKVQADAFRSQAIEAQAKISGTLESKAQGFADVNTESERAEIDSFVNDYLGSLRQSNLLSPGQLVQRQDEWNEVKGKVLMDAEVNAALAGATSNRNEDGTINLAEGQKFINSTKLSAETKLEVSKKLTDWDKQEKIANENQWVALKGQVETDWQKLLQDESFLGLQTAAEEFETEIPGKQSLGVDLKQEWLGYAEVGLRGEDIITDEPTRDDILSDITGIITGAKTREEVARKARKARFADKPLLDETAYSGIVRAIEAQYEQGFGQMMSRVNSYADGILLNPDSLGFIKNAPIRHQTKGDFQEAWLQWIAEKGDKLKLADIYPEGRRLAASYQISDQEAERRENIMNLGLEAREQETVTLPPEQEGHFQELYADVAKDIGINTNPDDPLHFYDYRALFRDTGGLGVGPKKHFPSKYKLLGHPNLIVDGKDTRTGEEATPELIKANKEENKRVRAGAKTTRQTNLDADTARAILKEADGDKEKARKIAKERGFRF